METRASYLVVGTFSLVIVAGALFFVLWAARSHQGDIAHYDINFTQGVSGLSVGNDVVFNGVKVGQVSQIKISPQDPSVVRVRIAIAADTPVRADSQASLEIRGITGLSIVSITGGSVESSLVDVSDDNIPIIKSKLSGIQSLLANAPNVVDSATTLIDRGNAILSPENAEALNKTLTSLADVTTTLGERRKSIDAILRNLDESSKNLVDATKNFNEMSKSIRRLSEGSMTQAAVAVDKAARRFDTFLAVIEPGMTRLTRESVGELQRLVVEARNAMQGLNRLILQIEGDPRRFFFGTTTQEFKAQ